MLRMWLSPYNTRELPRTDRYKQDYGIAEAGVPRGRLEPALKSGLTDKRQELVEAINSGSADYYGMFKRKFGVDVDKFQEMDGSLHLLRGPFIRASSPVLLVMTFGIDRICKCC